MRNLIAVIALGLAGAVAFAAEVKLESCTIERQVLRAPATAVDLRGKKRAFNEVYIVRINGTIPAFGATPVQLFIGDDPVREYGGTERGIYFKVYDPALLQRWNGKPIRYALSPGKVEDSGLRFRTEQPLN